MLRIVLELLFLPGVIVHELGHQVFCHLTGTPVLEVCYFRLALPVGYVVHGPPRTMWRQAWIVTGPFFFNSALGFLVGLLVANTLGDISILPWILLWLGLAIARHAFPSLPDALALLQGLWEQPAGFWPRLILTPLGGVMVLGEFGSYVLLDLLYGVLVTWVLPRLYLELPLVIDFF